MGAPKLTRLELRIMDALWDRGSLAIREIVESFPEAERPAYSTIQTMVYRLESKAAIRRVKKISNAHIFEAAISRPAALRRYIDEVVAVFGGRRPLIAHLIDAGQLSLDDVRLAQRTLRKLQKRKVP